MKTIKVENDVHKELKIKSAERGIPISEVVRQQNEQDNQSTKRK